MRSSRSDLIVQEALSWVGTPYHHAADIKGRGVDCAMLLVRVFVDTGLVAPFDPRPYPPDWYMHKSEERFMAWVEQFGSRLPAETPEEPGDVRLYQFGKCASHGGIVVEPGIMVHADRLAGRVERCETSRWDDRYVGTWRVKA